MIIIREVFIAKPGIAGKMAKMMKERMQKSRVKTALEQGLHVIACVGESEAEREAGETDDVLSRKVGVLDAAENHVIAYEPVWAISNGKTANPELAQQAPETIKTVLNPESPQPNSSPTVPTYTA